MNQVLWEEERGTPILSKCSPIICKLSYKLLIIKYLISKVFDKKCRCSDK